MNKKIIDSKPEKIIINNRLRESISQESKFVDILEEEGLIKKIMQIARESTHWVVSPTAFALNGLTTTESKNIREILRCQGILNEDFSMKADIAVNNELIYSLLNREYGDGYVNMIISILDTHKSIPSYLLKEYVYKNLFDLLPDNFIFKVKDKVLATKNPYFTPEEIDDIKKNDLYGFIENQSLYHKMPDERLLSVIRDNGFKCIIDHDKGAMNTGSFEIKQGLQGIFTVYGGEYFDSSMNNLVVFPQELLFENDTVCTIWSNMFDGNFTDVDGESLEELPTLAILKIIAPDYGQKVKKLIADIPNKDFVCAMIGGLVRCLSNIISPQEAQYNHGFGEIVINPQKTKLPEMIIVEDEPEYFLDEAVALNSPFQNVPMIRDDNVKAAIDALDKKTKGGFLKDSNQESMSIEKYRQLFILAVRKGMIDINEWKAHPTEW
ncbi:MAG: hypothetical protein DKM50_00980 [Candidatus Margulisiibacteriota bacterium]|nr:MAG: hypothetical protein DKM50_00980 [Candidatus Margulisiibacteriota bacterium]HCY36205.1 hypothetical protein [Candidatus Margulisiibacteriota bacterium]